MENVIIDTPEMINSLDWILEKQENVFITGQAGTGKTTFLKTLKDALPKDYTVVCAPTGIAALNCGGQTIHSLFGFSFGPQNPKDCQFGYYSQKLLKKIQFLIIDEVSMVRADLMDAIDQALRKVKKTNLPFGGVQIIMFGDPYQLPPVVPRDEETILEGFYGECGYFFFDANVWKEKGFRVVTLTKIFRQHDPVFIEFLGKLRDYKTSQEDFDLINKRYTTDPWDKAYQGALHICSLKKEVEGINNTFLTALPGTRVTFRGSIEGKFSQGSLPNDLIVTLSPGARVMYIRNNPAQDLVNGALGTVKMVETDRVMVEFDDGRIRVVSKITWDNMSYKVSGGKIIEHWEGSYTQIPLRLAWAITIHKSQGLTFDKAVLHLGGIFSPGQLYVALSRCKSLEGLVIDTKLGNNLVIKDNYLQKFFSEVSSEGGFWVKK